MLSTHGGLTRGKSRGRMLPCWSARFETPFPGPGKVRGGAFVRLGPENLNTVALSACRVNRDASDFHARQWTPPPPQPPLQTSLHPLWTGAPPCSATFHATRRSQPIHAPPDAHARSPGRFPPTQRLPNGAFGSGSSPKRRRTGIKTSHEVEIPLINGLTAPLLGMVDESTTSTYLAIFDIAVICR